MQNTKNRLVRFFPDPETSFPRALALSISSSVYLCVTVMFAGKQNLIPKAFFIKLDLSIFNETKSHQVHLNKICFSEEHTYPFPPCCSLMHLICSLKYLRLSEAYITVPSLLQSFA